MQKTADVSKGRPGAERCRAEVSAQGGIGDALSEGPDKDPTTLGMKSFECMKLPPGQWS